MTATAAAYCASNPIVYVQVVTRKSAVAAPIFRLTALTSSPSPSPPPSNISSVETAPLKKKQRSDSHEELRRPTPAIVLSRLPTTTDQRDSSFNEIEIEQILIGVGLRRRTTQRVVPPTQSLRPLTKRLAVPVCLLPLKTNTERIRHALSIVLPYLKFLSITHDLESFCFTDASIFVESLPSRSGPQIRSMLTTTTKTTTTTIKRKTKRHLTSKADFIASAGEHLHQSTAGIPMNNYVRSALNCQVVLDRLDEFAIDQIMKNSNRPLNRNTSLRAISEQSAAKTSSNRNALNRTTTKTTTTRTTITTLTTEKTTVKQKSTRTSFNPVKRLKVSNDDCLLPPAHHGAPQLSSSSSSTSSSYQRIYLKCFICSKREYIDARLTTSDALHLHWLEHGNDLSLNIYDSIIDSMLTRVVEFFHFPKQHTLEGKIQTVFILNSEEVRQSRPLPASDDACIILD